MDFLAPLIDRIFTEAGLVAGFLFVLLFLCSKDRARVYRDWAADLRAAAADMRAKGSKDE